MSKGAREAERLRRLAAMARMVFDARALQLRRVALARDAVRAQIAGLDRPAPPEVADDPALARAACAYAVWAASRREALNRTLARREAEWLDGLDDACRAFGRQCVLEDAAERATKGRRPGGG